MFASSRPHPDPRKKKVADRIAAASLIEWTVLLHERALLTTKWPEYRFLSPLAATQLFQKLYVEAYRSAIASNVDLGLAQNVSAHAKLDLTKPNRALTQIWLARQRCDELGLPYKAYLEFCFEFAARVSRNSFPRPNQLHPSEKSATAWLINFKEFWSSERKVFYFDRIDMDHYRTENYKQLPAQEKLRRDLIPLFAAENGPRHIRLGNLALVERYLPLAECAPAFEESRLFSAAVKRTKEDEANGILAPKPVMNLADDDLWQSCFGLPTMGTREQCAGCCHMAKCERLSGLVEAKVSELSGNSDPVAARKRELGRRRKQKFDAKKRMLRAGGL